MGNKKKTALTRIEHTIGKEITRVSQTDCQIMLEFGDKFIIFESEIYYEGDAEIKVLEKPDYVTLYNHGLIPHTEYLREQEKYIADTSNCEFKLFLELKKKFENKQ